MKKTVLITAATILFMSLQTHAMARKSTSEDVQTKVEKALTEKGRLFVREFFELGIVTGLYSTKSEYNALVIHEPGKESERVKGLKIEIKEAGPQRVSHTSFMDQVEIENLDLESNGARQCGKCPVPVSVE